MLIDFLVRRVPAVGVWKRQLHALGMTLLPRLTSYSQHGEDLAVLKLVREYDLKDGIYADVGANHPVNISNTYLFYRWGFHGITIDANAEMVALHKRYRSRDLSICVGCADRPRLARFAVSRVPVLSSFADSAAVAQRGGKIWRTEYVPILTLDAILEAVEWKWIYFLNVDVETLDHEVLQGARSILPKVFVVCVEANSDAEGNKLSTFMRTQEFEPVSQCGCNLLFRNQRAWFNQYRNG